MWLIFKWVFFLSFMVYFYHVGGGGISTLLYSLILYAMVVGGVSWVFNDDSPAQGSVSPVTAEPERKVDAEQGELVNARRGNPDPTRPKPDWMDNRPDWMKGN